MAVRRRALNKSGPALRKEWTVRAYRPTDHARVVRLWRDAGIRVGPSDSARELERTRRRDPDLFLVAEIRGRLVGAVLGRFDGRRGWINHLAVAPRHRRAGLGRYLVERVERRLLRKGCAKVNLHIERENQAVSAFYTSMGYRARDLLFMEKWIRSA